MTYKIVFFDIDGTITNHRDGSIVKDVLLCLELDGANGPNNDGCTVQKEREAAKVLPLKIYKST